MASVPEQGSLQSSLWKPFKFAEKHTQNFKGNHEWKRGFKRLKLDWDDNFSTSLKETKCQRAKGFSWQRLGLCDSLVLNTLVRFWSFAQSREFRDSMCYASYCAPLALSVIAILKLWNVFGQRSVKIINFCNHICCRSQWPRGLRRWVCGRSFAGIVGSSPADGMDVCLLWVLCVVR